LVILGVDPGLATVGFGILEQEDRQVRVLDYGVITTPAGLPLPRRLDMIFEDMQSLIREYKPDTAALEELFFGRNITTAIQVGHARGAALVAIARSIPCARIFEYTPMQIKQAVCGYGGADKQQMQQMVKMLLGLDTIPKPDDAADALGVALCHSQCYQIQSFQIQ